MKISYTKLYIKIVFFFTSFSNILFSSLFSLDVSQLSLEEKIGQVLMVHFYGTEANEDANRLIQEAYVGGIIYYNWANELRDPNQVRKLSSSLQQSALQTPHAIPLLLAIDQEGGIVTRLKHGFTIFPGNYALGRSNRFNWGKKCARIMGSELKGVGISLNLAPVVDVFTQPRNPVIGIRSFSSDPIEVVKWGKATLRGYQQAGIIAAIKHFPGHGDVKVDSHDNLPIVNKDRETLDQIELFPFVNLAPFADVIMTGHLLVPALDEQNCVTYSKKIVTNLLRDEIGFKGVVMTDSLSMGGALSQCHSVEECALRSLQAGHDLILLGGKQLLSSHHTRELTSKDILKIHQFLVQAVQEGRLSEKCLNDAVSRIISLKLKYGLFDDEILQPSSSILQFTNPSREAFAYKIASQALQIFKGSLLIPINQDSNNTLIIAPKVLKIDLEKTSWNSLAEKPILYFEGLNPNSEDIETIINKAKDANRIIFFANQMWRYPGQIELFQKIAEKIQFKIAVAVRDPLDTNCLDQADILLCTYSPVMCALQAAYDKLFGSN